MWQILTIVLISICVVAGNGGCPGFAGYKHNPSYLKYLDGDLVMVYTTSTYVLECEQIAWTVCPHGKRTASLKDATGCQRVIDNFDTSNPEYIQHTISPVTTCSKLPSTEVVRKKLFKKVTTCDNLCIFIAICHPSRNGILVACRKAPRDILLRNLGTTLTKLVGSSASIKTINQANCIFGNTCVETLESRVTILLT
ncbi:uncharacterized protein LOC119082870 [Bradysia coprophila]|uniref:uncharacterized protein LOC119082870 n=1 Tax=Bradysia coprophila TaxID=38358 RepID=UPI00187D7A01|nr:uncharacterized protein LOC119082870 [Bradysia coprophila]